MKVNKIVIFILGIRKVRQKDYAVFIFLFLTVPTSIYLFRNQFLIK